MRSIKFAFLGLFFFWFLSCAYQKRPAAETTADFNAHYRRGAYYLHQGSYKEALEELDRAIALNPSSAAAHNLSGMAHFQQKDYDAAEGQFRKAVELNPSLAVAYNNLGGVYAIKHQWNAAKENLKKAISLSPDMASAYFSLGTVQFNLGEAEEATACFAKGIALDPECLAKHSASLVGLSMSDASLAELSFTFARLFASSGDLERTVEFLTKAKQAGFHDWRRIAQDRDFEKIRNDPRIQEFLKD
jgi:tetratricopeptide (TPR) repeat protein